MFYSDKGGKIVEGNNLGKTIKRQRGILRLTLRELADKSGVSVSHLARIERGERFPSGHILRKIAEPLQFSEKELLCLAGYLSPLGTREKPEAIAITTKLDPVVAQLLAKEPIEVQLAVPVILELLETIARSKDFGLCIPSIKVDGVPLQEIIKELIDWTEDKVQGIEKGQTETFQRAGNFKLLGLPLSHFEIEVKISDLSSQE